MYNVKIRKEHDGYLVYFPSERLTTVVNETGASIADLFFNRDYSVRTVAEALCAEYSLSDVQKMEETVQGFLHDLKDRVTKSNVNIAEQHQLDYPLGVEIEITTGCNLRCKHCFQGEYKEHFMSLETFTHIVDILESNHVYEINLVGGEVFHHKRAMDMIQYVASKGMALTIVTNATLISEQQIQELSKIQYLYILISLDGNEEVHDYIRGTGMYGTTVTTAKKIRNAGINTEFLYTLNSANIHCYREAVEFSKSVGIPINFNLFKPFSKSSHNKLVISPEVFFHAVEDLLRMRVKEGYKIGLSNAAIVSYALGLPDKNECTASLSGMVINTDGQMLICPYLVECGFHQKNELPVFNEGFLDVWRNSDYFNKFRNSNMRNCQACSYIFSGDVNGLDPYGIDAYKQYRNGLSEN